MQTSTDITELAESLFFLFAGYEKAHGSYAIKGVSDKGKAQGQALTHQTPVTVTLWEKHLAGGSNPGLGVLPLRQDDTLYFGALDIDVYNLDHKALERKIKQLDYPLIVCRTKSGGAHLYVFFSEPVPAELARERLADWAAALGYGGCEVFPKQSSRASERDVGNWINMPYYGGDKGVRYAIIDGEAATVKEFLIYAETHKASLQDLEERPRTIDPELNEELFKGAPPCLQHLYSEGGFPEGQRNEGMFNIAVYLRKRFPDDWESQLAVYNGKMCGDRPRDHKELTSIAKSVSKREYGYRCKQAPIAPHCQKRECLRREYGIGETGSGGFELGGLTKYTTGPGDPVMWGIELNGYRLMVDNETLYHRDAFNRACMAEINRVPIHLPPARWLKRLDELVQTADVVCLPPDIGPKGMVWDYIEMFCLQKAQAKTLDEVWTGRPYRADGKVYFRSVDLVAYLTNHKVRLERDQDLYHLLREHGGSSKPTNVGGKTMNLWSIPEPTAPTDTRKVPVDDEQQKEDF